MVVGVLPGPRPLARQRLRRHHGRDRDRPRPEPRRRGLRRRASWRSAVNGARSRRSRSPECWGGRSCCWPAGGSSTSRELPGEVHYASGRRRGRRAGPPPRRLRPEHLTGRIESMDVRRRAQARARQVSTRHPRCLAGSLAQSWAWLPSSFSARRKPQPVRAAAARPIRRFPRHRRRLRPRLDTAARRARRSGTPAKRPPGRADVFSGDRRRRSTRAGRVVRFQVSDRSARVRVRLAFVSTRGDGSRTGRTSGAPDRASRTHTPGGRPPKVEPGSYRVRITARDSRRLPRRAGDDASPSSRPPRPPTTASRSPARTRFGGAGRALRRRAARDTSTRARTSSRARAARRSSRRTPGTITWVAYQAVRRGLLRRAASRRRALQLRLHAPAEGQRAGARPATTWRPASRSARSAHRRRGGPAPPLRGLGRPLVQRRPRDRPAAVPAAVGRR